MHATDLNVYMESAVAEVLEAMCFISSEGAAADQTGPHEPSWICGELDFLGDFGGTFGIAVSPGSAATIAANFLGEEEAELTDKETSEVICELTNMVCGTLLAQVNSQHSYVLSPPRPGLYTVTSADNSDRIERTYAIDEGYIQAWVELRDHA